MSSRTEDAPVSTSGLAFRAKGLVYHNACDFYEQQIPGGLRAVLGQLDEPELRTFLQQPFATDRWYDAIPIAPISLAAAKARRSTHAKLVRENAAWSAARDLQGPFRSVLRLGPIPMVAQYFPKLSMQFFDFGSAEARMLRDKTCEVAHLGVPASLASWFVWAVEGYVPVVLTLAGAKDIRVKAAPPRPDGDVRGMPTMRLAFEIIWR
jgi:hypothetical protein